MKQILLLFITSSLSFAQSLYANMTIYKDDFALIKQPVLWEELESDQNIIIWDILPIGIVQGSPFLSLDNANVLIQSFNQDVFRFSDRLYNYLGTKVDVKLINENDMNGTLVEVTDKTLTLQRRRSVISFNRDRIDYINIPGMMENIQFKPTLKWTIETEQETDTIAGNLTYLTSGFDWNANYRFIVEPNGDEAQFISEASVVNNSNINFENITLSLVEGQLNMDTQQNSQMRFFENKSSKPTAKISQLGDYHIYSINSDISLISKETIITRLYPSRKVSFNKTYLFENDERGQKEEPLSVEYAIPNTAQNNLGLPMPQGKIQLYQLLSNGNIEFIGQDKIMQIPKNETATVSSGKAFDVIGERKVLNYDRQRKSEEASISVKISNTLNKSIDVRLIEHIYGDWVVRNASSNYRKVDASTIHFSLSISPESSRTITYTYRKEWK
ncbi:MAG: hypothetical protein VX547_01335 [Candidatus Neomarinimicrobiota bacterium]|nr:hypothetical protein [Candidatus Neomarinimicrobiota bacterium]|tara:strand:+ start:4035 stop:5366 length:1332 start_codon:yes stop_codon:yes gene_type:complete